MDLRVDLDDDIAADEGERIKQSIAAMVQHSVERRERQREVDADARALMASVAAPLNKLIEADSEEITSAVAQYRHHVEQFPKRDHLEFPAVRVQDLLFDLLPGARSLQVFAPPFHFSWHWHSGHPAPDQIPQLDRPTGSIALGDATGAGDCQVSHHAGFGISLSTDRPRNFTARSLRRTMEGPYLVASRGFDASATVEGGTDIGVMENGTLIRFAEDKVFRERVSGFDGKHVFTDGWATGNALEVSWQMLPGSRYEFNVGAWVYCESQQPSLFPDTSVAWAHLQAQVLAMTVDEH